MFSWDGMTGEEVISFLLSLVPYLNAGTITLTISIGLEKLGFKITRREFKKNPLKSLFWGLCLIFLSSIISTVIQTRLSGLEPFLVFIFLFAAYFVVTQA
jgi:hypothetical protein